MARHFSQKQPQGQRQLRVGEEIRHVLSQIFMRGELPVVELRDVSITVSEVRISPDLKNATAYFMPLGGMNAEAIKTALNENATNIRYMVGKGLRMKFTPRISFRIDDSFDEAHRINSLLHRPEVARDVWADDVEGDEENPS